MKTKSLLFCLLFLVLGTTTALADKYYKARYSFSSKHRVSELKTDGTKYMIYNTTFNNNTDFTGFLYQGNTGMGLWKSKDSGIYIYNQCFVFTLENASDDDPATFYVKSENGVYIDVEGNPSVDPVKLYFYNWDDATHYQTTINEKDTIVSEYSVDNSGVVHLNERNDIKQAFVRSEHEDYTVIPEHQITFKDNKVFVICNEEKTKYWSGSQDSFLQWESGQPFAFYETDEVTSMSTFDIKDLHIFSRCDIYSAQKIYGYVQDAGKYSTNHQSTKEGSLAALLDDNYTSYFHSTWETDYDDVHYLQADLGTTTDAFHIFYKKRMQNNDNRPTSIVVYGTNTPNDESSWAEIKTLTGLPTDAGDVEYFSDVIESGTAYQHLRFAVTATNSSSEFFTFSEFYVLPNEDAIVNARAYLDASLPLAATEADFKAKIDEYNMNASAVKLLSGVPIPGNKYRFYADTYSGDAYVSRDVSIAVADDVYSLVANTNYHTAGGDATAFEWYCEETSNGKLVFRNVKYPTKYLANGTVSDTPYEWVFNTNYTQHHGVPLSNNNGRYLTLLNDGTDWVEEIGWIQNQKSTANCTDFVFLPVDVTGNEKRITIIATELATRNARLTLGNDNTKEYDIPFSRIYSSATDLPKLVSMADGYHKFAGFFKKGSENTPENNLGTVIDDVYNNIASDDTLEARFTVEPPFVKSTDGDIKLFRIKNNRPKQVATQQARPNRASINVEEGGQVGSSDGVSLYAKFATKDSKLELVYAAEDLASANTLFYFTNVENYEDEAVSVFINSAITTKKFKEESEWTDAGKLYFVQPNLVNGGYTGYTISGTKLDATNNPGGAWYGDYDTNTVKFGKAEDEGSAWDFEPVDDDEAKELLKEYINSLAVGLMDSLISKEGDTDNYDTERVQSAKNYIQSIVGTYDSSNKTFSGSTIDAINITSLVRHAQNFHMLEHELAYALQRLPDYTKTADDVDTDKEVEAEDSYEPAWYYVKNVYGTAEAATKGEPMYARHNGADNLMKLHKGTTSLANLFYFAGTKKRKVNEEYNDDYLDVHVHNFMAQNLTSNTNADDSTLVSDNNTIFQVTNFEGSGEQNQDIADVEKLSKDIAWEITAEFDNATGTFSNGWGTSLLATGTESNGGGYENGFQVFLKVDGSLVIKGGDSGNYDTYKFTHTQNAYSHLKIVLSYAEKRLKVYVTNSQGLTQSVKDIRNDGRDYIPCEQMADITQMCAFMPKGVYIKKLAADAVSAMKWNKHSNNADGFAQWFIHPSSNTTYLGHSITVEGPDDINMGWANADGENDEVFVDMGTSDYATWQFEKVTDFDAHINEFIELCGIKQYVIYNKEYAALYNLIMDKKADIEAYPNGANEEIDFNAAVKAFRDYRANNGPDPETLKAPKPGHLYTIRPAEDEMTKNALLVHVDRQNTHYATTELYKGVAVDNAGDTDSRAAWMFEGTESDGFLQLTGLKAKNIHTQTYLGALGADSTKLAGTGAAIALAPLGACTTSFKVGNTTYMSATGDAKIAYISGRRFWGYALDEYPSGLGNITKTLNAGEVHGKSFEVTVETAGTVTVTFTHNGGSHKLNILGVTLNNAGGILKSVYRHGTAGGNPTTQTYELGNVDPGTYTLHCYVWDFDDDPNSNDDDKVDSAKGDITITGISSVASITNTGTANTKWIVEEIEDPTTIVYNTSTNTNGHSTLMLGFNATIPVGVEAFYATDYDGKIRDEFYLSMTSYGEPTDENRVLPANTPVILRNTDKSIESRDFKFYYTASTAEKKNDLYMHGSLYFTPVKCDSFDIEYDNSDVNIYMLHKDKTDVRMYWVWENYDKYGDQVGENMDVANGEGYVLCHANKAFITLPYNDVGSVTKFSFRFPNSDTTLIEDVEAEEEKTDTVEGIFDLQGRRIKEITQPGIYIVNGKKVFVK